MSALTNAIRSCAQPAARSVTARRGVSFPASLALLWPLKPSLVGVRKSAVGPAPEWSYTGAQYDADGVNVGAVPAWHTGKGVWCGPAYTQMLTNSKFIGAVSGSPGTAPTNWTRFNSDGLFSIDTTGYTFTVAAGRHIYSQSIAVLANTTYYYSLRALFDGVLALPDVLSGANRLPSGTATFTVDGSAVSSGLVPAAGWRTVVATYAVGATAGNIDFRVGIGHSGAATGTITFAPTLTFSTLRNAPYVASDTTGPVTVPSAAGTSGGNGMAWAMSAKMTAALSGKCTVAALVTMGVGSGDIIGSATNYTFLSWRNNVGDFCFRQDSPESNVGIVRANDGTQFPTIKQTWPRNELHLKVLQVNVAGTNFRIGNRRLGTESAIQWGSWTAYDGSFNPLDRLRAGYSPLAVPLHLLGVQIWTIPEVSGATIEKQFKAVGVM